MYHLQRGKVNYVDSTQNLQSATTLCHGITLYIVKIKLPPKNLKLFHFPILIIFVFVIGCATSRSISTHSRAGDSVKQLDIGVILSISRISTSTPLRSKTFSRAGRGAAIGMDEDFREFSGFGLRGI